MTAIWAWDEIAPHVRLVVHLLDPTEVFDRRCRARHDLAVPVVLSTPDAQLDLVTLRTS
jgi:hypothetical protein